MVKGGDMPMKGIETPGRVLSYALSRDPRSCLRGLKRMQRGTQNVDLDAAVSPSLERSQ